MTEQQQKWFASVRASLAEKTGRPMAEWLEIATICPETRPRAPALAEGTPWPWPELRQYHHRRTRRLRGDVGPGTRILAARLWAGAAANAIRAALQAEIETMPGSVTGQRKGFTGWSRRFAFAAARPLKHGQVRLGLAIGPNMDARLEPARNEG